MTRWILQLSPKVRLQPSGVILNLILLCAYEKWLEDSLTYPSKLVRKGINFYLNPALGFGVVGYKISPFTL